MPSDVIYSRAATGGKNEWGTPRALFDKLNARYHFTIDAAANAENALLTRYWGPGSPLGEDALAQDWQGERVWLNPPYQYIRQFVAKAAAERLKGAFVVMLITSRTDTRWWHDHISASDGEAFQPGVHVQFVKGRIKFVDPLREQHGSNAAPFPSAIVRFHHPGYEFAEGGKSYSYFVPEKP